MKKDENLLIGVLVSVFVLSLFMNNANAVTVKNNLSQPVLTAESTAKAVFLVSKPKNLVKVKKNIGVLAKYQNATSLSDRQL